MISWIMNLFKSNMSYQQRQIEKYLANSSDLVDLERRQQEIIHGKVKF